jgi:hypothetical protein
MGGYCINPLLASEPAAVQPSEPLQANSIEVITTVRDKVKFMIQSTFDDTSDKGYAEIKRLKPFNYKPQHIDKLVQGMLLHISILYQFHIVSQ